MLHYNEFEWKDKKTHIIVLNIVLEIIKTTWKLTSKTCHASVIVAKCGTIRKLTWTFVMYRKITITGFVFITIQNINIFPSE